mgnify:CR=1 FL=1
MYLYQFLQEVKKLGLTTYHYNQVAALALKIDLYATTIKDVDLQAEAEIVTHETGITLQQMQTSSRKKEVVKARIYFIRRVVQQNPVASTAMIAKLLNKDRSSVYHYAYRSKTPCPIPPLKLYIRNLNMVVNNPNKRRYVAVHKLQKTKAA